MCKINGHEFNGYVDTGCQVVAIRESEARQLNLVWDEASQMYVTGYAGGRARTLGTATAVVEVDLIKADTPIVVVPDELQKMAVLIGQPFINRANVVLVVKNGQLRLFDSSLAQLPEIDKLPTPEKVKLVAKENVSVAPNHIGVVRCVHDSKYKGDLFIELRKNDGAL
ncbi:hypothetical protein NQ314_008658 [Rhamnusium bicolor]|uniref:Uncharacterized protein n=1 Tax=Rhamnusium bicolor TaxID=1586634 RepID=A0AAV8Y9W3_9CUCU|nr:hypothetical protein NQ314_008658 [Rhamnusium bicolor]